MIANAWIADITKAKDLLNFKQEVSLEEGIILTFDWYKKEGWL